MHEIFSRVCDAETNGTNVSPLLGPLMLTSKKCHAAIVEFVGNVSVLTEENSDVIFDDAKSTPDGTLLVKNGFDLNFASRVAERLVPDGTVIIHGDGTFLEETLVVPNVKRVVLRDLDLRLLIPSDWKTTELFISGCRTELTASRRNALKTIVGGGMGRRRVPRIGNISGT